MVNPLIYKSTLEESVKRDIKNQIRQVLAYYMGQYVHLVNKEEGGIKSREAIPSKKRVSKKEEQDSDEEDAAKTVGIKNSGDQTTPATKIVSTAKSTEKGKDVPVVTTEKPKRGRPPRKSAAVKKEATAAGAKTTGRKRKATSNQDKKISSPVTKKTKSDDDKKANDEASSSEDGEPDDVN